MSENIFGYVEKSESSNIVGVMSPRHAVVSTELVVGGDWGKFGRGEVGRGRVSAGEG